MIPTRLSTVENALARRSRKSRPVIESLEARFALTLTSIGTPVQLPNVPTGYGAPDDGKYTGPEVAKDSQGAFVVVFVTYDNTTTDWEVMAQRYNASDQPQGSAIEVSNGPLGIRSSPTVAMDSEGDFVVGWQAGAGKYSTYGHIFARRFNSAGTALDSSPFQVDQSTVGYYPRVAMDAAGDYFAFTWEGKPAGPFVVDARVFKFSTGAPNTNDFQVSSSSTSASVPWISMDAEGDVVVSFNVDTSTMQHEDRYEAFFGIFSTSGAQEVKDTGLTGTNSTSGPDPTNTGWGPAVSMDAKGDFVITWQNLYSPTAGYTEEGIYAEVFTAANYAKGVSPTPNGIFAVYDDMQRDTDGTAPFDPTVAIDWSPGSPNGDYYWTDAWTQSPDIHLQQYQQVGGVRTSSGSVVTADKQSPYHQVTFNYESIATDKGGTNNNGDVSVTWNGNGQGVQAVSLTSNSDGQQVLIAGSSGQSPIVALPDIGYSSVIPATMSRGRRPTGPVSTQAKHLQEHAIRALIARSDSSTLMHGRRGYWIADRVASGDLLIT
jgi:hypothetical protein